jgi:hypothetical protein
MVTLPNIGLFDLGLSLIYLAIIYFFAARYQKSKIKSNPEYRYFLFGLSTKIVGSIAFGIISLYYYQKGDTFLYFQIAEDLRTHLFIDFKETLSTFFTSYSGIGRLEFNPLEKYNYYYERTSNWDFGRLIFLFNLISFGSYLVSSILMGVVSFLGLWLGYKTMCSLYQSAANLFFIPFFLIPTALIWSSGILKDTIIIGVIGLLLFTFSEIFIYRKRILINALITILGIFILQLFRPILLFVLIPSLFFWGLLYLTDSIKIKLVKIITRAGLVISIAAIGWFINQSSTSEASKYKIDNLMKTLYGFQSFHSMEEFSEGQNVYTLGGIMATPEEVIKNIPEAINVTFFRPYVWEINNVGMLLGGVESLILLILMLYVLVVSRKTIIKTLIKNNDIIIMLIMALIYAIIVGVSSYNFGALSRYKIPAILFFLLSLIILYKETKCLINSKQFT